MTESLINNIRRLKMPAIPQQFEDLVADEAKAFAFLGTLMSDGSPQVTPLWFNVKDQMIWINSVKGRTKDHNIRQNPFIALAIQDPKNPYRYLQIRGKVVEIREEGALDHIDELSFKYRGKPYTKSPDQVRVIYIVEPSHISGFEKIWSDSK
jgi:PPOX class probable F420-dependent enzyme